MTEHLRLGVNIDHVATLRNARGGIAPDPIRAARVVAEAGADGITAHLREDRRHINDADLARLKAEIALPLNMEMAATVEMVAIALDLGPAHVCVVPERREELTTEGGLDVAGSMDHLRPLVGQLTDAGIQVAMFIDPDPAQIAASAEIGAPAIELHTGEYCNATDDAVAHQLARLVDGAEQAQGLGLECHAGHGLDLDNVEPVAAIPQVVELNIGHAILADAVFDGLALSVRAMRAAMDVVRGL
ncbi:MAG: pyridoxine 5'-phosphate synthase [Alphaproteobacteria bacterium]|jgi:pyridoxine 5-phosphate synthase|nr:pyridoxine 5'-phosphate synthase [Alphaproteobacteria bacterium]MBT4711800.1 pyridoxine 5'-phosphate synthase [Alphaproteobacteria bacterium]